MSRGYCPSRNLPRYEGYLATQYYLQLRACYKMQVCVLFFQHFLGDATLTLPQMYHHSHLAQGDFEPILRVFLLDPSFHAFVEKVEGELKKLQE